MTMIGSSVPASGGEHLFSHTLDMMSLVDGIPHELHGRQMGLGSVFAAALCDRLRKVSHLKFHAMPNTIDHRFWGKLTELVEGQYRDKLKNYPQSKIGWPRGIHGTGSDATFSSRPNHRFLLLSVCEEPVQPAI